MTLPRRDPLRGKSWAERRRIGKIVMSGERIATEDDEALAHAWYRFITPWNRTFLLLDGVAVVVMGGCFVFAALTGPRLGAAIFLGAFGVCLLEIWEIRNRQARLDLTATANGWPRVP